MGRRLRKKAKRAKYARTRAIDLSLRRVELARSYDGPLRGAAEPTLVIGVYSVTAHDVTLVSRTIIRLQASGAHAETLEVESANLEARVPRVDGARALVLAAALEEDDGRGVSQIYAELESPEQLAAWSIDAALPEPLSLLEWARATPPEAPATVRVHLVDASGDLRDRALGDDWIGAAIVQLDDGDGGRSERRMRFVSADGRNDWTAVLDVRRG